MKQLIQLLILKSEGIPLFTYSPDVALKEEDDDPMLVSGFMSAINQFITSTKRDQLNELGLSRGLIIIEEDKELNVLFTLYISDEIDVSWGKRVLQAFRERFIDQFRQPLEFFSGNISQSNPGAFPESNCPLLLLLALRSGSCMCCLRLWPEH